MVDTSRQSVLSKYGLNEADFLARGMEAEVYRYGADAVLKIYGLTTSSASLRQLQYFYATINRSSLSYALPSILHVADESAYTVTIEKRLAGTPLAERIKSIQPQQLESLFTSYIRVVLELATIAMPVTTATYKLSDPHQLGERTKGDWHVFLRQWLVYQLQTLSPAFKRDVIELNSKLDKMLAILNQPYQGSYNLIHGDIFPGNVLVAPDGKPLALLDFGLFTMYGDPLFDAATAWVFFDMYNELGGNIRRRLLPFFLDLLGTKVVGKLYRYVLLYSMLSANTYAADCSDGHYTWCVANLNTSTYWDGIE